MLWVGFLLAWLRLFDEGCYDPIRNWFWLMVLFLWIGAGIGSFWNRLGTGALVGAAIGTILSGVTFTGF
jgi:hypothetical protein